MLKKLKLQPKFFLYFSGLVFITLILVITTIFYFQRQMIYKLAEEKALSLTHTLAHTSFNAILFDDYLVLQSIIDGMSDNQDIVSISIIDTTGKIIASNNSEKKGTLLKDDLTKKALMSETYLIQSVPTEEGNEIWDTAVPIYELNKRLATARIKYSVEDTYRGLLLTISAIGITVLLFSIFLSYRFSKSISNPIREAVKLANEFGNGNQEASIDLKQQDEIGDLIRSLNKLSGDLKSLIEEKITNESLILIGEFASYIIHDLKNQITGFHLLSQGLHSKLPNDSKLKKYSSELILASQRLEDFIVQTLDITRDSSLKLSPVKINELIDTAIQDVNFKSIKLNKKFDDKIPEIYGDSRLLSMAFINLFYNAIDAISDKGEITVETKLDHNVIIKFTDNGAGIPPENLKIIFRPFFSMKDQGHGLGLAMVKKTIILHNAEINVESKLGHGTTFTIFLPCRETNQKLST